MAAGDNLSKIARHFYGDANAWKRIFDANRDQLTDPDRIRSGQMLKIPPNPEIPHVPLQEMPHENDSTNPSILVAALSAAVALSACGKHDESAVPIPAARPAFGDGTDDAPRRRPPRRAWHRPVAPPQRRSR